MVRPKLLGKPETDDVRTKWAYLGKRRPLCANGLEGAGRIEGKLEMTCWGSLLVR